MEFFKPRKPLTPPGFESRRFNLDEKPTLETAKDFAQLYKALDDLPPIREGLLVSRAQLVRLIDSVRQGNADIESVPTTHGLRDRVEVLLQQEHEQLHTPRVRDIILLEKRSIAAGPKTIETADSLSRTMLAKPIVVGEPLDFGHGRTSPVESIEFEGSNMIVNTATAQYIVSIAERAASQPPS